jgi:3-methyl-2-oxobutanoate hydroxymethyltransferase
MAPFVRQFADVRQVLLEGATSYAEAVRSGAFPGAEHTF